jgi:hypothetical protein
MSALPMNDAIAATSSLAISVTCRAPFRWVWYLSPTIPCWATSVAEADVSIGARRDGLRPIQTRVPGPTGPESSCAMVDCGGGENTRALGQDQFFFSGSADWVSWFHLSPSCFFRSSTFLDASSVLAVNAARAAV